MINRIKILCFIFLLSGCKYFEPQVLDDSDQIAVDEGSQRGVPALKFNNGYIDDFGGDISSWWSASPDLILTRKGDTLKVDSRNVGSKYVPFGKEFAAVDMSEYPVLKVRMRFEGNLAPDVRIDLTDIYGKAADQVAKQRMRRGDYRDYYFVYDNKWKQFWPVADVVDSKAINKISVFINPGTADWTGQLYVDEIKFVKVSDIPAKKPATVDTSATAPVNTTPDVKTEEVKKPEEVKTTSTNAAGTDTINKSTTSNDLTPVPTNKDAVNMPVSSTAVVIDDFGKDINAWWSSSDSKIKISKAGEMLKVDFKEAGPAYETFGRGFGKIDFTKTPIVKVRVKAEGVPPSTMRVDIKDASGFSTNAKPIAIKLKSGTDFVDYYYDFTGKFEQAWPNVQKVSPQDIVELLLFVNPGGQAYTGTLYIDEIKAISLEDFNNKK